MKICVLGAGVIGVSTAYALARLGHDVSVIEKASNVAMGASKANGAQLSYSYIDPLASPKTFRFLPQYFLGLDKAIQLKFSPKIDYLRWGSAFLQNCTASRFAKNRAERQLLSDLSKEALDIFQQDLENVFQPTGKGKLILAHSPAENEAFRKDETYLSAKNCLDIEPALQSWKGPLLGGIYSDSDYALNTQTYCEVLKRAAEKNFGVSFFFDETFKEVQSKDNVIKAITTDKQEHISDKVIICLGNEANDLLKPLGLAQSLYPIQGYSLTLPSKPSSPRVSITDLKHKMVYAHLGDVFRIAGFVDTNQSQKNVEGRISKLLDIAQKNWPDVADFNGPIDRWTGARPMTPSGVPVIGESKLKGLYLNVGHGSLGYTFAAGSAMKIANKIGHARQNKTIIGGTSNAA